MRKIHFQVFSSFLPLPEMQPDKKRNLRGCDRFHISLPIYVLISSLYLFRCCLQLQRRTEGLQMARRWARFSSATEVNQTQPWDLSMMSALINPQVLGWRGRASCQVWSHFRLMSADISLEWLQTCEREISEEFFGLMVQKWNVSIWPIHQETFTGTVEHFTWWIEKATCLPLWDTSWTQVAAQNKVNVDPSEWKMISCWIFTRTFIIANQCLVSILPFLKCCFLNMLQSNWWFSLPKMNYNQQIPKA